MITVASTGMPAPDHLSTPHFSIRLKQAEPSEVLKEGSCWFIVAAEPARLNQDLLVTIGRRRP